MDYQILKQNLRVNSLDDAKPPLGEDLIFGDSLEILPSIPNESADCILTDPPFGIESETKIARETSKKYLGHDIDYAWDWDKFGGEKNFWEFTEKWIDECVRILKPGRMLMVFFDRDKISILSKYLQSKWKLKLSNYFHWIKSNPVPRLRGVGFQSGVEMAGLWKKPGGKTVFNKELGQQPNYMILSIPLHPRYHPTQKPLELIKTLILYWTLEGEVILDPFLGGGTSYIAAKELNRKCIGIEKEESYYKIAKRRSQQTLIFDKNNEKK